MSTGFVLIVIGIVLGGGAFLFAIGNMVRGINNKGHSFEGVFKGHLGAMGVVAVGGIVATIGLVMVIADFVQKL